MICNDICPLACASSLVNAELNDVHTGGEWIWKEPSNADGSTSSSSSSNVIGSGSSGGGGGTAEGVGGVEARAGGKGGSLWWLRDDLLTPTLPGTLAGPRSCIRSVTNTSIWDESY